jgi:17beta-estradiol 17-dehydrogenase / very-long-chain 3-oxoacyl-CoA reductase
MAKYSYLEITGIVVLSYFGIKLSTSILRGIWTNFLGHSLGFGVKWRPGDNVWAVITGGTDGIGLQYAKQLAAKGYSIVIISRNENKLNSVAESLMKENPKCKEVCNAKYSEIVKCILKHKLTVVKCLV